MGLRVVQTTVTPFQQNSLLLIDGSHFVVVDPGGEISRILITIRENVKSPVCDGVLLTHSHIDHCGGVAALMTVLRKSLKDPPKLYGHEQDRPLREAIEQQSLFFGLSPLEYRNCPEPDVYLGQNDEFIVGGCKGKILFTPGHAPGHVSLYFEPSDFELIVDGVSKSYSQTPLVIAGDALFAGSIGRTDLPLCNHDQLINSIRTQLLTLPSSTVVLCGHGPSTTIGLEARTNPFLAC